MLPRARPLIVERDSPRRTLSRWLAPQVVTEQGAAAGLGMALVLVMCPAWVGAAQPLDWLA